MLQVSLDRCPAYGAPGLSALVGELLQGAGCRPTPGTRVLVKPNLISAADAGLAATHPAVVRAVCEYLLAHGCRVQVGDSPAFGTGRLVARKVGIVAALRDLPVSLVELDRPRAVALSFGERIGISAVALESELLVNVPKCKVHVQMRLSLAVKNCFGCVAGMRKPLAHARYGEQGTRFESMLLDILAALPAMVHLIDGITAMHVRGPMGGQPFALGLLGASASAVALDTALATVLGVTPEESAIWQESLRRGIPGSRLEQLDFPRLHPRDFAAAGFQVPGVLRPVTFNPLQLARGACKRLLARLG
ncbi:DUF362 domain-containing protein [Megalodesulfovibrio gigas]|nr:DUF362 domain-containing protein [Megalodesulfovibrio gigas]